MRLVPITPENREEANAFIREHWHSTTMILRGECVDLTLAEGTAAYEGTKMAGLVTWKIVSGECEITSLDSLTENCGLGTLLLQCVARAAREAGCMAAKLITTNDNLRALQFYQKRGFYLSCLYPNAMEENRRQKPSIPLIGENGIPLRDELELKMFF